MKICVSQKRVLLLLREVYLPTEPVQQRSGRWVHLSFLLCKKKRGGGRERLLSPSSFLVRGHEYILRMQSVLG